MFVSAKNLQNAEKQKKFPSVKVTSFKLNEKQLEAVLKATVLGSHTAHVQSHTSLKSSRGVIHTDSLAGMSDEQTRSALADQFVSWAYRLIEERDNRPLPLAAYLHVVYERFPVPRKFPTPCGANDVRRSKVLSSDVLLSLSVHSAVRVGTERSHVKTHSAV
jgi:hypothetical protein